MAPYKPFYEQRVLTRWQQWRLNLLYAVFFVLSLIPMWLLYALSDFTFFFVYTVYLIWMMVKFKCFIFIFVYFSFLSFTNFF